jgi:hypothetical protein
MNIDDASLTKLKVYQIEKFLTSVLMRIKQDQKNLMLNPNSSKTIIYEEYINSLRQWRSLYNSSGNNINPNPFFPKYDIEIKDYQKYHEYIMSFTDNLVFHSISKDKIILRDAVEYLKETDLRNNNNYVLYNTLSKINKQYQIYILNQVVLATYECKNYEECIDAFVYLFQNDSYKKFASYRMNGLNIPDTVNYHKLLTENIPKEEMTSVINSCIMQLNLNHDYKFVPTKDLFKEYVDTLLYNYKKQTLEKTILSSINQRGIEETKDALNNYNETKDTHVLINGQSNDDTVNRYLLKKYVKPSFMNQLILGNFEINKVNLSKEEILDNYVESLINNDKQLGSVKK